MFLALMVPLMVIITWSINDHKKLYKIVDTDFKATYPKYELVSSEIGEGDLAVVYVHIKFNKPDNDSIFEEVWQYWDLVDGIWTHRDSRNEK